MEPIGPKLAEGRDSEIFEHGPGRVLRLARDGRSLETEAEVMRHARAHGYPCLGDPNMSPDERERMQSFGARSRIT